MSDLKPIAYAIYGIGGGKHYLKDVKPIQADDATEEWRGDDDFLGDYWAGNEPLFLASTQPEATKPAHADQLIGLQVSMDVSTGGDDAEHRIFGKVIATMPSEDGITILAEEESRNFAPAQDLSAAILALPLPKPFDSGDGNHEDKFTESQFREFRAAAAALASPANALVAGDGVDAITDTQRIDHIEAWSANNKARGFHWNTFSFAVNESVRHQLDEGIRAAIQAQKGE